MIDKGNCNKCSRKIQETLYDKCMFCGEPLTDAQCFTTQEKETIRQAIESRKEKRDAKSSSSGRSGISSDSGFIDFNISSGDFF